MTIELWAASPKTVSTPLENVAVVAALAGGLAATAAAIASTTRLATGEPCVARSFLRVAVIVGAPSGCNDAQRTAVGNAASWRAVSARRRVGAGPPYRRARAMMTAATGWPEERLGKVEFSPLPELPDLVNDKDRQPPRHLEERLGQPPSTASAFLGPSQAGRNALSCRALIT